MKTAVQSRWSGMAFAAAAILLSGIVSAQTVVPTVTITSPGVPPRTMEPCPTCLVVALTVTVARTGPTTNALSVGLRTGGTATSGLDYQPVPDPFVIPAGKSSASFFLNVLDDNLAEGPEVVDFSIKPGPGYTIGLPGSVRGVIGDDEADAPTERLDFTLPANGDVFPTGVAGIDLRALAVSTTREIDVPVEFYANGILIGKSSPISFGRPPIPWLPRDHDFRWLHPADGEYILTARTPAGPDQWLEASPIRITVGAPTDRTRISIVATQRIAEEDSAPTLRPFIMRGEFTISRTGPVINPQTVYLLVSGTAISGTDYKALPFVVSIPAGSASAKVQVEAIPDNIAEPLETVIAEVSNCPPGPILPPCFDFDIDPAHARDTVFIRDDGITRATIEITAPPRGAQFTTGEDIVINATAIDIDGTMTKVDFYAGDHKIGVSELFFFVEPPPGTPIYHTFTWSGAPPGSHILTAQGTAGNGARIVSAPVPITVGGNRLPAVRITKPADGAQFPSGTPIEIEAAAVDPDGYTGYAAFYADGHKLGEVVLNFFVEPPPGETQTYSFTWRDAAPGNHVLSVRVRDDQGGEGISPPVTVNVAAEDGLPVIVVGSPDPFAIEPGATPANNASFRLKRSGSTAAGLAVNYSVSGTATNGIDYTRLNGTAFFAAGGATVDVIVEPLADNLAEGRETVIFKVELQFDDGPQRYNVGHRSRAGAVIADPGWQPPRPGDHVCQPVGAGHFHLCFHPAAAFVALAYRVEATDDFVNWETVHEGVAVDSAVHFVDPDTPDIRRRFYRMAPDPMAAGP